jgi:hypothetical protein
MRRHDEMRQQRLRRRVTVQRGEFGHDAVRSEARQQVELPQSGGLSPLVGQIDDFALRRSDLVNASSASNELLPRTNP